MLNIQDLYVQIKDNMILKGLNLRIKPGEVHALMGVNGSGKSTLVKTLSAHYDCKVKKGTLTYNNKNLLNLDVTQRANEGILMSFQNPIEIAGINNMYFLKTALNAKRAFLKQKPINAATFLKQLKEITKTFSLGYDMLKRDLNEGFSGGEKKRNELLQLLVLEPNLLLLDEIDSGLDIDAIDVVSNAINSLRDGKRSVLMITHYERVLKQIKPDFVHILENGRIIQTGDYSLAVKLGQKGFKNIGFNNGDNNETV